MPGRGLGNGEVRTVHRADIHSSILKACRDSNLISLETSRRVTRWDARKPEQAYKGMAWLYGDAA